MGKPDKAEVLGKGYKMALRRSRLALNTLRV